MSIELNLEGLPDEVKAVLASEQVQSVILAAVEAREAPLKQKRDELLGKLKVAQASLDEVEALGGIEKLKVLPEVEKKVTEKTEAEKTYAEQVKDLQKQLSDLKQQSINAKLNERIQADIRELKGVPELLDNHVKSRIKHELDENGALRITVLDKSGVPMFVDGKEAGIKDLLTEFKGHPTLARAFDAPQLNGGGTKQSATVTGSNPFAAATRNLSEQGRLVRTDRAVAVRLANEAGVKIVGLND